MALVLFENTFVLENDTLLAGIPEWIAATAEEKERALINASSKLNEKAWASTAVSSSQEMAWPRATFNFFDTTLQLWVEVTEGTVPLRLRKAVVALAIHLLRYPTVVSGYEPSFDTISVGPISVSNSDPTRDPGSVPSIPASVELLVQPMLRTGTFGDTLWWRAN